MSTRERAGSLEAIFSAAKHSDKDRVLEILRGEECPAELNVYSPRDPWTLLHYAAANDWKDVAEILLEKGADAGAVEHRTFGAKKTSLELAMDNASWQVVGLLVGESEDQSQKDNTLFGLVRFAPDDSQDAQAAVQALIRSGARVNYCPSGSYGWKSNAVLHAAVEFIKPTFVELLVNARADVLYHGVGSAAATLQVMAEAKVGRSFQQAAIPVRRTSPIVLAASKGDWSSFDLMFRSIDFERGGCFPYDAHQQPLLRKALVSLNSLESSYLVGIKIRAKKLIRLGAPIQDGLGRSLVPQAWLEEWAGELDSDLKEMKEEERRGVMAEIERETSLPEDPEVTPTKVRIEEAGYTSLSRIEGTPAKELFTTASDPSLSETEAELFLMALMQSGAAKFVGAKEVVIFISAAYRNVKSLIQRKARLQRDVKRYRKEVVSFQQQQEDERVYLSPELQKKRSRLRSESKFLRHIEETYRINGLLSQVKVGIDNRSFADDPMGIDAKEQVARALSVCQYLFELDQTYSDYTVRCDEMGAESYQAKTTLLVELTGRLQSFRKVVVDGDVVVKEGQDREEMLQVAIGKVKKDLSEYLMELRWEAEDQESLTGGAALADRASAGINSRMKKLLASLRADFPANDDLYRGYKESHAMPGIFDRSGYQAFLTKVSTSQLCEPRMTPYQALGMAAIDASKKELLEEMMQYMSDSLGVATQVRILFSSRGSGLPFIQRTSLVECIPVETIFDIIDYAVNHQGDRLLEDMEGAVASTETRVAAVKQHYELAKLQVALLKLKKAYEKNPQKGSATKRDVCSKILEFLSSQKFTDLGRYLRALKGYAGRQERWIEARKGDDSELARCIDEISRLLCFSNYHAAMGEYHLSLIKAGLETLILESSQAEDGPVKDSQALLAHCNDLLNAINARKFDNLRIAVNAIVEVKAVPVDSGHQGGATCWIQLVDLKEEVVEKIKSGPSAGGKKRGIPILFVQLLDKMVKYNCFVGLPSQAVAGSRTSTARSVTFGT